MTPDNRNPASAAARTGSGDAVCCDGEQSPDSPPRANPQEDNHAPDVKVAQAKIDLIVDDVGANSALMIANLEVILAMRNAGDTVGLIYSARRAQAYWRFISASTRDLIAAEAERQSALRQREGAL